MTYLIVGLVCFVAGWVGRSFLVELPTPNRPGRFLWFYWKIRRKP